MDFTIITEINRNFFTPFMKEFGKTTVSFGLLIEGMACGVAQFTITGHSALLAHIEIASAYRRQGGGTYLLQKSGQHLMSCGMVQLLCHPSYIPWDDHYYLNFFLTYCGFQHHGEIAWVYTMPLDDLANRLIHETKEHGIVPLTHFPKEQCRVLVQTMSPTPETSAFEHHNLMPHLSMVVIEQRKLAGFILVHQHESARIEVTALRYTGNNTTMLGRLLSASAIQAKAHAPSETMVTTMVTNPQVAHVLDRILVSISHTKCPVHQFIK